jgi:hypothetical protein
MILIFCEQSGQNDIEESTRAVRSDTRCCIDMMISLQGEKDGMERLILLAELRLYKTAHSSSGTRHTCIH